MKKLHEDIQIVRVPRQAKKKLSFAFFEFGSEAKCEEAKVIYFLNLTTNSSTHPLSFLVFYADILIIYYEFIGSIGDK